MKSLIQHATAVAILLLSAVAQAQQCEGPYYIDEYDVASKYFIGFRDPIDGSRPIVWPPDPANRGKVPFGQHSSGQSIAELEDELHFNGTILSLLDGMNALIACMTREQAQFWRGDPRVEYVEEAGINYSGLSPAAGDASRNNPQLSLTTGYTLTLPFIDYAGIPGQYQHAKIEYLPVSRTWRLAGYRKVQPIRNITTVDVVVTEEMPVQVFLKVAGTLNNGCLQVGDTGIRHDGKQFTVYLFYQYFAPECMGTDDVRPFRKVVPLDVYGLPAGTYTWTLNEEFSGSFTLTAGNVLE